MFGPYAEAWLAQRELKPRTQALYRRLLDRFILPAFAEVSLRDITPQVVREPGTAAWIRGRPTQRAHTASLLRSILSTAVTDEIRFEPLSSARRGSAKRVRSIEPATLGELEVLLERIPRRIAPWCSSARGVA